MEAGITISNYCNVYGDENDACFIALEAGITISYYCDVSSDENVSSSSFGCNETRFIFIVEYVSTITSVHPNSNAMKLAFFSSKNTYGQ